MTAALTISLSVNVSQHQPRRYDGHVDGGVRLDRWNPRTVTAGMAKVLVAVAAAAALAGTPVAHAGDPDAERAYLDEFHQAVPVVPIVAWGDKQSLETGYLICQAAHDGINLDHYRNSAWQRFAVDPALRHLCPAEAPPGLIQPAQAEDRLAAE